MENKRCLACDIKSPHPPFSKGGLGGILLAGEVSVPNYVTALNAHGYQFLVRCVE